MRPECRSLAVIFTLDHVSPSGLHLSLISHHSRCNPALSVFASKCMDEYHAGTAALCDLGDPGWIPGFRIELLLLLSPDVAHWCVFVRFCFVFYSGPFLGWHIRCHRAWNSNCWLQSCHCPFLAVSVWVLVLVFVCFLVPFLVCVVFDGIAHWTLYWSTTSSFEAADSFDSLASNYNSACLLRLNVCNDLAKAMKALDGKKRVSSWATDLGRRWIPTSFSDMHRLDSLNM